MLLVRPFLHKAFVLAAPEMVQPKRAFILDFVLCCIAGVIINAYDALVFGIPVPYLASLMIGCIIAGFFIGLDSSLAQERTVIIQAKAKDALSTLPKRLFPMTRKFTLIAVTTSFFVSLVLMLVFNRDVEWLTQTAQDAASIQAAQLSVSYEIFFIMTVLMILIVNLIFSYSRNLKLLFDNETKVLKRVRTGDLSTKVPIATYDEFGIIAEHTNHMIDGLRHRFKLISSLKMAEEVQQNLLPDHSPYLDNFDISGTSTYCDETGGDYYDYFLLPDDKLGIVVADACGHGIGAAMLMTSVRAFLTSAVGDYQSPAQLLKDINNHITHDCSKSGRFTTMFFLEINSRTKNLKWVRAGHEPAVVFHADSQTISHLDGGGLVLGVDDSYEFKNSTGFSCQAGDIILIGTDGINETRNTDQEVFGHKRIEQIIRNHAQEPAKVIQKTIVKEVNAFRGDLAQEDDITLVVIKAI
ncbi:MAG: SpoIIE family protein phosphatase [Desulfobulbaceae bacterium]|nr:SpoIIE family protein phosphatase [Desulfobulbaceae bacterium]